MSDAIDMLKSDHLPGEFAIKLNAKLAQIKYVDDTIITEVQNKHEHDIQILYLYAEEKSLDAALSPIHRVLTLYSNVYSTVPMQFRMLEKDVKIFVASSMYSSYDNLIIVTHSFKDNPFIAGDVNSCALDPYYVLFDYFASGVYNVKSLICASHLIKTYPLSEKEISFLVPESLQDAACQGLNLILNNFELMSRLSGSPLHNMDGKSVSVGTPDIHFRRMLKRIMTSRFNKDEDNTKYDMLLVQWFWDNAPEATKADIYEQIKDAVGKSYDQMKVCYLGN